MELNKDTIESRDKVLEPFFKLADEKFGRLGLENKWRGGTRHFRGLDLKTLKELIAKDLVEMEAWNECPPLGSSFLPFMEKHPDATAHGYAVSGDRQDSRITVEGIALDREPTKEEIIDFTDSFRSADDFVIDGELYCWFD